MANNLKAVKQDILANLKTKESVWLIHDQDISPKPNRKIRVLLVVTGLATGGATHDGSEY